MTLTRSTCRYAVGFFLVVFFLVCQFILRRGFSYPFPSSTTLVLKENTVQDVGGVLLGMRRAAADLAFLQMLQYYGTRKVEDDEEHSHVDHEEHSSVESFGRLLEYGR